MRGLFVALLGIVLTFMFIGHNLALAPYPSSSLGTDVSWPNCKEEAKLPEQSAFGIVGVNDGLDFTGNPCLTQEADWFHDYSLYLSTGYPGPIYGQKYSSAPKNCMLTDYDCLAFNYGYAATRYAINYASLSNVHSTNWWLDVETDNSWTENRATNVASLRGMIAALRQFTFLPNIGFYAYPAQWNLLTGSWHNGLAAWSDSGTTEKRSALADCNEQSFTGGPILLTQFTVVLDEDYACAVSSVNN